MRVFHCSHCQQLVFFENSICINCGHTLAFLPDIGVMSSLVNDGEVWTSPHSQTPYRLCDNYTNENICNWAVPMADSQTLCISCRLTQVIPDPGKYREAWYRLEVAKRRLLYSLLDLGCPIEERSDQPPHGLAFQFLADSESPEAEPVLTGHCDGIITVNIAEADDAERERRRCEMREPYRTLLGHFRHEIGHYYWVRLIRDSARLDAWRESFGDERQSYPEALQTHYQNGPPQDWQQRFVSAYASAHPWEDWAETWAHYLHMTDTLEIAVDCGLSLRPRRADEPKLDARRLPGRTQSFDTVIEHWFSLTYVLNNLSRGLGLPDGYPFVLSTPAIEKLRFVHETIDAAAD